MKEICMVSSIAPQIACGYIYQLWGRICLDPTDPRLLTWKALIPGRLSSSKRLENKKSVLHIEKLQFFFLL